MKKIFLIILLILALSSFYFINIKNYEKIVTINRNAIGHPENLPTKEVAKSYALWFKNLKADIYWIETVQYIWWNALSSDYKKYLYSILDIITELDPYFEHPYIIWELLLPSYNNRYEDLNKEEQNLNINQWISIWKKGVDNFCTWKYMDKNWIEHLKIDLIKDEYNFDELKNNDKFKNPCKSYKIPYNLAFIYYYYLNKPDLSSYYYRVAYANDDTTKWAKIMAAIMKWKWWNREKSFFMFLNMASEAENENKVCWQFSKELLKASKNLDWNTILRSDTNFIKEIEKIRMNIFPNNGLEYKISNNISCVNYLNKAVRELNLNYIELANKSFSSITWNNSNNAKELFEWKYIDFLPTDPQDWDDIKIIYYFNNKSNNYDYKSWEY